MVALYEYVCRDCKKITEVRSSFAEKEKGLDVTCEHCGSKNVSQYFGNMTVTAAFPLH